MCLLSMYYSWFGCCDSWIVTHNYFQLTKYRQFDEFGKTGHTKVLVACL
jgi:hypothetical protein